MVLELASRLVGKGKRPAWWQAHSTCCYRGVVLFFLIKHRKRYSSFWFLPYQS